MLRESPAIGEQGWDCMGQEEAPAGCFWGFKQPGENEGLRSG